MLRGYEEKTCVGAAGGVGGSGDSKYHLKSKEEGEILTYISNGVGGSGDSKYHLKHVAADVIAMVDGLGVDTFHLCGHDWGRCVA